jgi:N-methylhydantoinase A
MSFVVAVDIGGTFTDLVAYDHDSRDVLYAKSPTTYDNFVDGIMECFGKAELSPANASFVNHGTTLVINALIQRKGAKAALVTTKGFRDTLEIARGNRPAPFELHYQRDEPLIPREHRYEIEERIDARGEVVRPLDEAGLEPLAATLRAGNIESVAVSFINSYANPDHERAATDALKRLLPDTYITCGTDLSSEWYEYERGSTVAANAYVGPDVSRYITNLDAELRDRNFPGTLYMMGSNGGVLSAERACRQPIALVESGPIGGCIGAAAYAKRLGFDNVISFDMGGTTAKCALVEDGRFSIDSIYYAAGYVQGFPIKSSVLDVIEVGSGGGSIAWLDPQNRLHVGPQSAGSTPGPVCYGNGGTEPTITDANLLLGRLDPQRFLGGEMALDVKASGEAVANAIAGPLGYQGEQGVVEMADGILSIATVIMAGAIRRVTVEHGRDPRDFILFSYGGAGPLHTCALAHELSIPTVVIPPEPGNFSATGMLMADARLDSAHTFTAELNDDSVTAMRAVFSEMEAVARETLIAETGKGDVVFEYHTEMRYRGQRHNIRVPITRLADAAAIRAAFEHDYRRRYGHADENTAAELQALHLSAFAPMRQPEIEALSKPPGTGEARESRQVYFKSSGSHVDTRVYDRYSLEPGFTGEGPAILEEYGSTTVIWPGDKFEIGALREIRITCVNGE